MRVASTGRRAKEEETRRNVILEVAEELFFRQGLHHTSVADIAKEAECGIGTIYKYFEDKVTLIQSLMEERISAHFDALEAALETEGTPEEVIDRTVTAYFDSVTRAKAFFGMFYTHFHPGPKDDPHAGALNLAFLQTRKHRFIEQVHSVFKSGIEKGVFAPIDPDYLASAFLGMLISFFCFAEGKFKGEWDVEGMSDALKRILFGGVIQNEKETRPETDRRPNDSEILSTEGEIS